MKTKKKSSVDVFTIDLNSREGQERSGNPKRMASNVILSVLGVILLVGCLSTFYSTYIGRTTSDRVSRSTPKITGNSAWEPISMKKKFLSSEGRDNTTCYTVHCQEASETLEETIDTTVDPCDNFYKHACGKWIDNQKEDNSKFRVMRENKFKYLKDVLEKENEKDIRAVKGVKKFYKQCMDMESRDKNEKGELLRFLKSVKLWPMSYLKTDISREELTEVLIKLRRHEISQFYSFSITNQDNSFPLVVDNIDYLLEEKNKEALKDMIRKMISYLEDDDNQPPRSHEEIVDKIVQLELELSSAIKAIPRQVYPEKKLTLPDIIPLFTDKIDKKLFMNSVFPKLTDETHIVLKNREKINKITQVLNKTPTQTVVYLVFYRVISHLSKYADSRFVNAQKHFKQLTEKGSQDKTPIWRSCVEMTDSFFPDITSAIFVKKYFTSEHKRKGEEMISYLRKAFSSELEKNDWMDLETKRAAQLKLDNMEQLFGYYYKLEDDKFLEEDYEKVVDLTSYEKFFSTVIARKRVNYHRNQFKHTGDFDRTKYFRFPATFVNAAYYGKDNQMLFPAAIMQKPVFDGFYPQFYNFGGIGAIMGHEITHGFDSSGRKYNYKGEHVNWWSEESLKNFKTKKQCLLDQYSDFVLPIINQKINATISENENIADNGGTRQAYLAYNMYISEHGPEQKLPNFPDVTNEQMFFLANAQFFCRRMTNEDDLRREISQFHAFDEFRVNGPLSNMDEFSSAFNCPVGSPMNPPKKCRVW